jgi:glycerophosphoryl diester phosphodiesterase
VSATAGLRRKDAHFPMAPIIPELIAHRGHRACYPENSLPGIRAAIAAGARYVEVDVQLSADRVPVLFHDADLKRVCGVPGAVHDRDLTSLLMLSASERDRLGERFADNRLASLEQMVACLRDHPGVAVFVEIKRVAVAHFGVHTVLDAVSPVLEAVSDRCVLISFSVPLLAEAGRRLSNGKRPGWSALGGVIDCWDERDRMAGLGLGYLFCDVRGLPASGPIAFESARIAVYEVADPEVARALAARGVRFIETFDLPGLRARLTG